EHLNDTEIRQLSTAMARLRSIKRDEAAAVHEEAWRWLSNRAGFLVDGERFVAQVLQTRAATGARGEQTMMRELRALKQQDQQSLAERLKTASTPVLVQLLAGEHPQVIAFVLANLQPRQAAEVLAGLPEDLTPDVLQRIAELTAV